MKLKKLTNTTVTWLLARPKLLLGFIITIYSSIVIGNLTRWSIWFDEAFSAYIIRFDFGEIARLTAFDVHPPLYYWLLKLWTIAFGTSELAVRSMSLMFGIIAIIGFYVLIKRLFKSTNIALLASGFVAITPIFVRFSHEARMYTLVLAIVIWATYLMVRMVQTKQKRYTIGYGILIAAGMLTHYFAALAWAAHWLWHYVEKRRTSSGFFDKQWASAYILSLALFSWWMPSFITQIVNVQKGFWIPPLTAATPVDYISNTILYRQFGAVSNWWVVLFLAMIIAAIFIAIKGWRILKTTSKSGSSLLFVMTLAPPVLLMIASLPPLSSTFIDRYVMFAQIMFIALIAICFGLAWRKAKTKLPLVFAAFVLISGLGAGIYNVYYYGNYNKNSLTSIRVRDVVDEVNKTGEDGQPIIAENPYIYYEAFFYANPNHQVFYAEDTVDYYYGSVEMLKNDETGKIRDISKFTIRHPKIWYLGNLKGEKVEAPDKSWKEIKTVKTYDSIDKSYRYGATLYDTSQ